MLKVEFYTMPLLARNYYAGMFLDYILAANAARLFSLSLVTHFSPH